MAIAQLMSEDDLDREVVAIAARFGDWLTYHTHRSDRSEPGFPDRIFISATRKRIVVAELKRQDKKAQPTAAQRRFLLALAAVAEAWPLALEVHLWRPENLNDGTIVEALR